MTLDVSKRLRKKLERAGLKTVMTRTDDTFIPLRRRVAIANARRNAIFVSVHFNSAPRVGAAGIETYYYSSRSAFLAARIHPLVVRAARTEDRRIRRRGFYVIRNTRIPAVLVECGFLTNPQEANRVKDGRHRQRLADAIAAGVLSAR